MKLNDEIVDTRTMPILLNYGGAVKALNEMNDKELQAARDSILRRAKEKAFSKGLPIYYTLNKRLVAEYADGRIEVVER